LKAGGGAASIKERKNRVKHARPVSSIGKKEKISERPLGKFGIKEKKKKTKVLGGPEKTRVKGDCNSRSFYQLAIGSGAEKWWEGKRSTLSKENRFGDNPQEADKKVSP